MTIRLGITDNMTCLEREIQLKVTVMTENQVHGFTLNGNRLKRFFNVCLLFAHITARLVGVLIEFYNVLFECVRRYST